MYNISDVDRNFVISTGMKRDEIRFFDARNDPFRLYGLMFENGRFCRMTNSAAKNVSDAVFRLNRNTAGGRVRFVTDSEYVAISAKMDNIGRMSHFSLPAVQALIYYIRRIATVIYCIKRLLCRHMI